jgi:hypothetical protein
MAKKLTKAGVNTILKRMRRDMTRLFMDRMTHGTASKVPYTAKKLVDIDSSISRNAK